MEKQDGEDETLFDRPERDRPLLVKHLERAENPVLHLMRFTA